MSTKYASVSSGPRVVIYSSIAALPSSFSSDLSNANIDAAGIVISANTPISWLIEHGYKKTPAAQRFARDMRDCGFEVRKSNGGLNYVFAIREGKQLYAVSDTNDESIKRFREMYGDE